MRPVWLAAAGWMVVASASAQRPPVQATPLPPLQKQGQQEAVPQGPISQGGPGKPGQGQNPSPFGMLPNQAPVATEPTNSWMPAQTAKIQALDKVNAQATVLTIKVGQSAALGSLMITVKACMVRPVDQPADSAAYLDVTDSHADSPGFKGWMLQQEPSVSMMQHPIYDLRVTGCA